jgi:hypothetical protein
MKNKLIALGSLLAFSPLLVSAQVIGSNCGASGDLAYTVCRIGNFVNAIIPILIGLAVVVFIWGVIQYVLGSSEEAKKEGQSRMIYGLIGLLVIVSIWGIVALLKRTLGVNNETSQQIPCVPSPLYPCP